METRGSLQIQTWEGATPAVSVAGRYRQPHWPPTMWGLIGTLLIHLLLLPSMLVVTGMNANRLIESPQPGRSGSRMNSDSEDLILLDLPSVNQGGSGLVKTDDLGPCSWQPKTIFAAAINLEVPHLEISEDQSDDGTADQSIPGDDGQSNRQHLAGIYSGQIRARIDRVWKRPRSAVSEANANLDKQQGADESFHCLVTIIQDSAGWVQETQLLSCNGSVAWQKSLVRAINQASPLPAPPDPKVFARAVTLNFVGFAFGPGMAPDEYESQSNVLAAEDSQTH